MAIFDLPLEALRAYRPERHEPADFDAFWQRTLAEARAYPLEASFESVDASLGPVETFDVRFNGWGGHPIKGWLLVPAHRSGPLPCVVEYSGYGGGRGFPSDWLLWSAAGYAHLVMDTRGQGSQWQAGERDHRRRPLRRAGPLLRGAPRSDRPGLHDAVVPRRRQLRRPRGDVGALLGRAHGSDLPPLHRVRGVQPLRRPEGIGGVAVLRPRRRRFVPPPGTPELPAAELGLRPS